MDYFSAVPKNQMAFLFISKINYSRVQFCINVLYIIDCTQAWGLPYQELQFICNYDLKLLQQIVPIDIVNLPCDNDFYIDFFSNYDLKMVDFWLFLNFVALTAILYQSYTYTKPPYLQEEVS